MLQTWFWDPPQTLHPRSFTVYQNCLGHHYLLGCGHVFDVLVPPAKIQIMSTPHSKTSASFCFSWVGLSSKLSSSFLCNSCRNPSSIQKTETNVNASNSAMWCWNRTRSPDPILSLRPFDFFLRATLLRSGALPLPPSQVPRQERAPFFHIFPPPWHW